MKDYASMSDQQINREVQKITGIGCMSGNGVLIISDGRWRKFDPCNNPADAWPIILQNRISVIFDSSDESDESEESDEWVKACVGGEEYFISYHYCHRALRAAMVAFLMMKEGE